MQTEFHKKAFAFFDEDVDGTLSERELKRFFHAVDIELTDDEFESIYNRCMVNERGDFAGKFLYDDFVALLTGLGSTEDIERKHNIKMYFAPLFGYGPDNWRTYVLKIMMVLNSEGEKIKFGDIVDFVKIFDSNNHGQLTMYDIETVSYTHLTLPTKA